MCYYNIAFISIYIIYKILWNNYVTIHLFLKRGTAFHIIVCVIKYGMGSMDNEVPWWWIGWIAQQHYIVNSSVV